MSCISPMYLFCVIFLEFDLNTAPDGQLHPIMNSLLILSPMILSSYIDFPPCYWRVFIAFSLIFPYN